MGRLNANITMLNIPPVLYVDRIGDGIVVNTYLAMERLAIKAFDAIIHPIMRCTIVCSIADLHYLKVSPEEAIGDENSAPFRADVVYGLNAVDTIRANRIAMESMMARINELEVALANSQSNTEEYTI